MKKLDKTLVKTFTNSQEFSPDNIDESELKFLRKLTSVNEGGECKENNFSNFFNIPSSLQTFKEDMILNLNQNYQINDVIEIPQDKKKESKKDNKNNDYENNQLIQIKDKIIELVDSVPIFNDESKINLKTDLLNTYTAITDQEHAIVNIVYDRLIYINLIKRIFTEQYQSKDPAVFISKSNLVKLILRNYNILRLFKKNIPQYKEKSLFSIYLEEETLFFSEQIKDLIIDILNENKKEINKDEETTKENADLDLILIRGRKYHKSILTLMEEQKVFNIVTTKLVEESEEEKIMRTKLAGETIQNKKIGLKTKKPLIEEVEKPIYNEVISPSRLTMKRHFCKLLIWLTSCFQYIIDSDFRDCNNNETIFNKIFPQNSSKIPIISNNGQYHVKLFFQGEYKIVTVDDKCYYNLDMNLSNIFVESENINEHWPIIILKSLFKMLKEVNINDRNGILNYGDPSLFYFIFGYINIPTVKDIIKEKDLLNEVITIDNLINKKRIFLFHGLKVNYSKARIINSVSNSNGKSNKVSKKLSRKNSFDDLDKHTKPQKRMSTIFFKKVLKDKKSNSSVVDLDKTLELNFEERKTLKKRNNSISNFSELFEYSSFLKRYLDKADIHIALSNINKDERNNNLNLDDSLFTNFELTFYPKCIRQFTFERFFKYSKTYYDNGVCIYLKPIFTKLNSKFDFLDLLIKDAIPEETSVLKILSDFRSKLLDFNIFTKDLHSFFNLELNDKAVSQEIKTAILEYLNIIIKRNSEFFISTNDSDKYYNYFPEMEQRINKLENNNINVNELIGANKKKSMMEFNNNITGNVITQNNIEMSNFRILEYSCGGIFDFFQNKNFNITSLKPLNFNDLNKQISDNKINYKVLTRDEKKFYVDRMISLRTEIKNEKTLRINNLIKVIGEQVFYVNLYSDIFLSTFSINFKFNLNEYKFNDIEVDSRKDAEFRKYLELNPVEYSNFQINMGKKCILNKWKIPPPSFFDELIERQEKKQIFFNDLESNPNDFIKNNIANVNMSFNLQDSTVNVNNFNKEDNTFVSKKKKITFNEENKSNEVNISSTFNNANESAINMEKKQKPKDKWNKDTYLSVIEDLSVYKNEIKDSYVNKNEGIWFNSLDILENYKYSHLIFKANNFKNKLYITSFKNSNTNSQTDQENSKENINTSFNFKLKGKKKNDLKENIINDNLKKNNDKFSSLFEIDEKIQVFMFQKSKPIIVEDNSLLKKGKINKKINKNEIETTSIQTVENFYNVYMDQSTDKVSIYLIYIAYNNINDKNNISNEVGNDQKQKQDQHIIITPFVVYKLVNEQNIEIKRINFTGSYCSHLIEDLNSNEKYYLVLESYFSPAGFELTVFSDFEMSNMSENDYLLKTLNFSKKSYKFELNNCPSNTFNIISKLSFKTNNFINNVKLTETESGKIKNTVKDLKELNSKMDINENTFENNNTNNDDGKSNLHHHNNYNPNKFKLKFYANQNPIIDYLKLIIIFENDIHLHNIEQLSSSMLMKNNEQLENYNLDNMDNNNQYQHNESLVHISSPKSKHELLNFNDTSDINGTKISIIKTEDFLMKNKIKSDSNHVLIILNQLIEIPLRNFHLIICYNTDSKPLNLQGHSLDLSVITNFNTIFSKEDYEFEEMAMINPFQYIEKLTINKGNYLLKDFIFTPNKVNVSFNIKLVRINEAETLKAVNKFLNSADSKKLGKKERELLQLNPLDSEYCVLEKFEEYYKDINLKLRLKITNTQNNIEVFTRDFYNEIIVYNLQLTKDVKEKVELSDAEKKIVNEEKKKVLTKFTQNKKNQQPESSIYYYINVVKDFSPFLFECNVVGINTSTNPDDFKPLEDTNSLDIHKTINHLKKKVNPFNLASSKSVFKVNDNHNSNINSNINTNINENINSHDVELNFYKDVCLLITVFSDDNLVFAKNVCKDVMEKKMLQLWEEKESGRGVKAKFSRNSFKISFKPNKIKPISVEMGKYFDLLDRENQKNNFLISKRKSTMHNTIVSEDKIKINIENKVQEKPEIKVILEKKKNLNYYENITFDDNKEEYFTKIDNKESKPEISRNNKKQQIENSKNVKINVEQNKYLENALRIRKKVGFNSNQQSENISLFPHLKHNQSTNLNNYSMMSIKEDLEKEKEKENKLKKDNKTQNNSLKEINNNNQEADFRNNNLNSLKYIKNEFYNKKFNIFTKDISRSKIINNYESKDNENNNNFILSKKINEIENKFNRTFTKLKTKNPLECLEKVYFDNKIIKPTYTNSQNFNNVKLINDANNSNLDENKDEENPKNVIKENKDVSEIKNKFLKTYFEYSTGMNMRSKSLRNNITKEIREKLINDKLSNISNNNLINELINGIDIFDFNKYTYPTFIKLVLENNKDERLFQKLKVLVSGKREHMIVNEINLGKVKDLNNIKSFLAEVNDYYLIISNEGLDLINNKLKELEEKANLVVKK